MLFIRGRCSQDDLQFDPEIERTARANRKLVRLSKSVAPSARIMGEPSARPKVGDYGLANHCGRLTHTFRPANLAAFDIKSTVLNGLRDKQFDGSETMSPHKHLSRFAETCECCVPPATVTNSQKKLQLLPELLSCLVATTQNRVVEKVVVQFVQSTFVNALCIFPPKCLQILLKRPLHYSTSLLPIVDNFDP